MGPFLWLVGASALGTPGAEDDRRLATTQDYSPPPTFFQTTMAFNPLGSEALSHMTLIMRPSVNMSSDEVKLFTVNIFLAGFTPVAERARDEESCKFYFGPPDQDPPGLTPDATSLKLCLEDLNGLHRIMQLSPDPHPSFERFIYFSTEPGALYETLTLFIKMADEEYPVRLNSRVETELEICCFLLPIQSPENNRDYQIEVLSTDPLRPVQIEKQAFKGSPLIVRGNYWKHLQLQFEPPLSLSFAVISVIVQSAQDITNQARIIVRIPGFTRKGMQSGDLDFNTVGNDWLLFEYYAYWNITSSEMSFMLREGAVLQMGRRSRCARGPASSDCPS